MTQDVEAIISGAAGAVGGGGDDPPAATQKEVAMIYDLLLGAGATASDPWTLVPGMDAETMTPAQSGIYALFLKLGYEDQDGNFHYCSFRVSVFGGDVGTATRDKYGHVTSMGSGAEWLAGHSVPTNGHIVLFVNLRADIQYTFRVEALDLSEASDFINGASGFKLCSVGPLNDPSDIDLGQWAVWEQRLTADSDVLDGTFADVDANAAGTFVPETAGTYLAILNGTVRAIDDSATAEMRLVLDGVALDVSPEHRLPIEQDQYEGSSFSLVYPVSIVSGDLGVAQALKAQFRVAAGDGDIRWDDTSPCACKLLGPFDEYEEIFAAFAGGNYTSGVAWADVDAVNFTGTFTPAVSATYLFLLSLTEISEIAGAQGSVRLNIDNGIGAIGGANGSTLQAQDDKTQQTLIPFIATLVASTAYTIDVQWIKTANAMEVDTIHGWGLHVVGPFTDKTGT